jgi:hypothetical protein
MQRVSSSVALTLSAVILAGAAHASEGCSKRELRARGTETIELQGQKLGIRERPAYYLSDPGRSFVFFFRPEDVLEVVDAYHSDSKVERMLARIRDDLPLKEDTDLFKYSVLDAGYSGPLVFFVASLLEKGNAIVDFVPLQKPRQTSQERDDPKDPALIKRVDWTSRGVAGRKYCTGLGFELLNIIDEIS